MRPSAGVVGDERDGQLDPAAVAVEVEDHLLEAAVARGRRLDVLDRWRCAPRATRSISATNALNARLALDPPAYRVMHLGLAGERLDQRIGLAGHQAVEEGHGDERVPPPLVQELLQHRRAEQLGDPRHAGSVPHRREHPGESPRTTRPLSPVPPRGAGRSVAACPLHAASSSSQLPPPPSPSRSPAAPSTTTARAPRRRATSPRSPASTTPTPSTSGSTSASRSASASAPARRSIDDIHTSVRDGTLRRHLRPSRHRRPRPVVEASVPRLSGIDASGSGDVTPTASTPTPSTSARTARPTSPCRARPAGCGSTWTARATRTSAT